jgi:hypothetical protein
MGEDKKKKNKIIKWNIALDGDNYEIKIDIKPFTGKHKIYVDNELVDFETPAIISFIAGFDQYIKIGDNDLYVTCRGGKLDLAINGKMRSDGKAFVPMPDPPKWMWVLCAFCIPVPFLGLLFDQVFSLAVVVSLVAILVCIYFAMQPKDEKTRVRMSTLAMGIPWVVFVIMPLFNKFFANLFS